jgi:hypothetical protein
MVMLASRRDVEPRAMFGWEATRQTGKEGREAGLRKLKLNGD